MLLQFPKSTPAGAPDAGTATASTALGAMQDNSLLDALKQLLEGGGTPAGTTDPVGPSAETTDRSRAVEGVLSGLAGMLAGPAYGLANLGYQGYQAVTQPNYTLQDFLDANMLSGLIDAVAQAAATATGTDKLAGPAMSLDPSMSLDPNMSIDAATGNVVGPGVETANTGFQGGQGVAGLGGVDPSGADGSGESSGTDPSGGAGPGGGGAASGPS